MNNQEKYVDDPLRQYVSPGKSEKAPEGFTSRIMAQVQLETAVIEKSQSKNLVPMISGIVTVLLLAAAFLIPGSQTDKLTEPIMNIIKNLKISAPTIDLSSTFRLNLPSVILYVVIGIFILTLFDRALQGIFKKEK